MVTSEIDYGKVELIRAHEKEEQVLDRWRTSDEKKYFERHPIARAKRSLGFRVSAPQVEYSLTIYEGRRGGRSLFLARASGEITGAAWMKTRYFEFERLVSTRREAYDLYFPDDQTSRLPSENSLYLFCSSAAPRLSTIDKASIDNLTRNYAKFCAKSRGERVGAIAWRLCEPWRRHIADPALWSIDTEKTAAATDLVLSSICSLIVHYHVGFGGEDFTGDDWALMIARLFPDATLRQVSKRLSDFQKFAHAMSNLDNALSTTKRGVQSSLSALAPVSAETAQALEKILDLAYWHGRWLEP